MAQGSLNDDLTQMVILMMMQMMCNRDF